MAKLTVIIPLYNQEQYIAECLDSIISQTYQDIEIIVVDDGSTDDSLKICQNYVQEDRRIKVIHQENKGLSGARYAGLMATKTKYVTFVDADDFILEDAYVYADQAMRNNVDMVFFEITRYFDKNNIKHEQHVLKTGYYDRNRIIAEIYPKLIWNFERNTPGIECSQCVRIVKKEQLINVYNQLNGNGFYYGDDCAITYPLYKNIANMEVISKSYYMHRQRVQKCAPYVKADKFFEEVYQLYSYLIKVFCENEETNNFRRQIEYFYMYSINLKRAKYGDVHETQRFLFPFNRVPHHKKLLLYGAGEKGCCYFQQLMKLQYCAEILWVDKRAKYMADANIRPIEEIKGFECDYAVIAIDNKEVCESVKEFLKIEGIDEKYIIY